MDVYANEQEQVEAIKRWLKENGTAIIIGLALGIGAISGWRYWQSHQRERAEAASTLFTQVMAASRSQQPAQAEKLALQILGEYADTTYGTFAALMLAKLAVEKQDLTTATQQLSWVLEHSADVSMQRLARIRLARVLLAEGKHDEAWSQLERIPSGSPSAALAELRGDIMLAQGKKDEAGKQYLEAYANIEPGEQTNESGALALKLDSLGLTPPMPTDTKVIEP